MRTLRRALGLFALLVLAAGCARHAAAPNPEVVRTTALKPDEVRLDITKYADLCKAVRAQRGQIVVLEVWGEF
jgi:hypothetical protein